MFQEARPGSQKKLRSNIISLHPTRNLTRRKYTALEVPAEEELVFVKTVTGNASVSVWYM